MIDLKFSFYLIFLYILLIIVLVAAIVFSHTTRDFLLKIHASKSDDHSWLRYALSVLFIFGLGIAIHNVTFRDSIDPSAVIILGIAITGKVTASGINPNK